MLLNLTMVLVLIMPLTSCVAKRIPPPPLPTLGQDRAEVKKGEPAPFEGTLMSYAFLNDYLQWKNQVIHTCEDWRNSLK